MRRDIATTYHKPWILEAPVIIVVCGDHNVSWRRPDGKNHLDIDIAIAVDHMTLAAAELGLGTCWVCMFNSMLCHEILKLPPNIETVALLPLGYPAEEADVNRHQTKRKPLEEIVHWDKF
jgi:nitroreductase